MTDYNKTTNFTAKRGTTADPAPLDTEFDAIATAVATKANTASPTFTGVPAAPTASVDTNTTQLATTAFVVAQITDQIPDTATLKANNLSDLASASTARTNLGLGTMATQAAGSVAITGGTMTGTFAASQAWTNMLDPSVDRAFNTNYTNSTGSPIQVLVTVYSPNASTTSSATLLLNGSTVAISKRANDDADAYGYDIISVIIPPGDTYRINSAGSITLSYWWELR